MSRALLMNALHKDLSICALYPAATRAPKIVHYNYLLVKSGAEAVLTDRLALSILILI